MFLLHANQVRCKASGPRAVSLIITHPQHEGFPSSNVKFGAYYWKSSRAHLSCHAHLLSSGGGYQGTQGTMHPFQSGWGAVTVGYKCR